MNSSPFPCKACTDREVGCHAKCEKYLKAKRENDKRIATRNKEYTLNDSIYDLKNNRMKSFRRGHK